MKEIRTVDSAGQVLCHDMTQIIPGVMKDAKFRKGHVVTDEDIPVLLSMGKEHIYVWEKNESLYHENEAAEILCELCFNDHMERSEVKEGKIELRSTVRGLLKIDTGLMDKINGMGHMMIASRHPNTPVEPGDKLCGTRIIPLVIEKEKMEEVRNICGGKKIFTILPFQEKKVGIVTTGSEVFHGRIKDAFGPALTEKLKEYDARILGQTITDDRPEHTTKAILDFIEQGADMVLVSGGMSVDPDDKTPLAIRSTGASVVSYGAPVLPGAMFLLSYYQKDGKNIPIAGLPGCVMYAKRTVFDLVLPKLMADDPVTKEELDKLGRGGLCLSCEVCHYPNCGFGKGW
ncbi:molybdopterin-binding protein [Clostridium sp. Marseille-P2415]|uniref:molybdopterin-binding protein n=1 Tax=Clostridium sp. Marseille-P2415 TaxID=1805471 RepID=UPI000988656B|nr:molybdopterin-binding protein [Clostridium sp. Marseille-P2415]